MSPKLPAGHFLGQTLRARELAGFRLTETTYATGLKTPRHAHELAKYCFVLAGNFTETVGPQITMRQPLALVFHPPDTMHEEVHASAGHHFLIEISPHWLARAREYSAVLDQPVDLSSGASISLASRLFEEFKHLDGLSSLAMEGLILELMVETSRRSLGTMERRPPRWLEHLEELLRASFTESLTLGELAAEVGVHTVHLARVFRKFHGCSIGDYVRQLRVDFASRELATTDVPLADIAAAAGFADQSHFSRTFKQHTRLQPTEFRNMFRSR